MRIISGQARGRTLFTLKGMHTRPTADKVKGAIFSVLGDRVEEARVLDAFAGSAALGLEAMSRGAAAALFIEADHAAAAVCARNIALLQLESCRLLRGDCLKLLPALAGKQQFDLIFLDPPYNRGLLNAAMACVRQAGLLAEDGVLVAETTVRGSEFAPGEEWQVLKSSAYGDTAVHYCRLAIDNEISGADAVQ